MNYYFITGASRGIGKAMAEYLLQDADNHVTGISRRAGISHTSYRHISIDLSSLEAVKAFTFDAVEDAAKIVLINNAGALTDINPLGQLNDDDIIKDFSIDLIAPALFMNKFIGAYAYTAAEKIIVNVSSGAGKNPVDGWSTYCASKAGLDMLTRVADKEASLGRSKGFRMLSIAPGIVDTQMQEQIRSSNAGSFSRVDEFAQYKQTGKLADPATVAGKYFRILDNLSGIKEVVISVNDY